MKRVLVTGGAGYIGSHTCKALHKAGFEPVSYDNLSTGHRRAVQWGSLCVGDLRVASNIEEVVQAVDPVAVVHFAAKALVGESVRDPIRYWQSNVVGTLNLLMALRRMDFRNIVFSSSCATYGVPSILPISEEDLQIPVNPYGVTKLAGEQLLHHGSEAYGIKAVVLRYFNAAGADPSGAIGEDHANETHLIPLVLETALGHRPYVEIFGVDYPTRDGSAIRDYVHVEDLAAAHVSAVEYLLEGGSNVALNLGTGSGLTVFEIIQLAEATTSAKIGTKIQARRSGDPPELIASAKLANAVLRWKPVYDVGDMLRHAYSWHREQNLACRENQPAG